MDPSNFPNSSQFTIPIPAEVTSPVKFVGETPSSVAVSDGVMNQSMIPVKLAQQQPEQKVCLLPVTTPFSNMNTTSNLPVQGPVLMSAMTNPGPLSPVITKTISSPLVALSSQLSMHIGPASPSSQAKLASRPVPPSSPSLLVPQSGSCGQSSHRSRKEKLICRSGADSMEVQASTPTPTLVIADQRSEENQVMSKSDQNSSPTKSKKPNSPTKGTRPYNRRKTSSESTDRKTKDSLSKRVLVSNAHRRVGLSPDSNQKRSYKRRNTIATSFVADDCATELGTTGKTSPTKLAGLEISSAKPKSPEKPKVTVSKGGLSEKEKALLPMLSKQVAPPIAAKSPLTTQPQPAPSTSPTNQTDKPLADLRMFGTPNVLPIFKPNQKPWNLLKRFLEGKDADDTSATDSVGKSVEQIAELLTSSAVEPAFDETDLELVDGSSSDSDSESSSFVEDSEMTNVDSADDNIEFNQSPFDKAGEEVALTNEARAMIEQLLVPNAEVETFFTKPQSNRARTESESSIPAFSIAPSPISFSRPSSTPISSNSNSESPFDVNSSGFQFPAPAGGQIGDQQNSRSPESYQFKPIQRETPSSPLFRGRESPGSISRYQPASPSPSTMSGSSANGASGRRYSRRRHSRMYPAFETSHCMYSKHFCCAPLEPGSTYCIKHVSEKYSPYYFRCAFMSTKNGRRCSNMQYSRDGKNKFCNMHASRLALLRQKLCRKPRPTQTLREHFGEMQRLQNKLKKPKRTEAASYLEDYCDYKLQTQCMENEIEVVDPPEINLTVEEIGQFQVEHDSDGGCDVQDEYECLKNAGYYTTEEVVRILKSKLSKLKELYLKEFKFLKLYYLLKRQEYLLAEDKIQTSGVRLSRNPKTLFKWKDLVTENFIRKEMKTFEKTKALLNYHNLRGQSAVLHHLARKRYEDIKEKEEREKLYSMDEEDDTDSDDGANHILRDFLDRSKASKEESVNFKRISKCKFDDEIIKCESVALPNSDYCHRHVLQDENQVLFQPCNYPMDNKEFCQNPLLKKVDRGGCDFHRSFRIKRFCKSEEEKKSRRKLLRSMPAATFKEHISMLQDLVASKFGSVEEFDMEVNYLKSKGLDCSDSSNSDYENDCDIQIDDNDDDERQEETVVHKRKRSNSYRKQGENSRNSRNGMNVSTISDPDFNLNEEMSTDESINEQELGIAANEHSKDIDISRSQFVHHSEAETISKPDEVGNLGLRGDTMLSNCVEEVYKKKSENTGGVINQPVVIQEDILLNATSTAKSTQRMEQVSSQPKIITLSSELKTNMENELSENDENRK
ncbi:unnamed protein product [Allacma fusca]|uniref:KAT8 regulatory NSL complex subunit 2 n=1 Tax=Allacma fusca TaxID=39272 RepID=A0A8J2LDH0_9HEXA|nr:unnamed protein product [Allacma fusca]